MKIFVSPLFWLFLGTLCYYIALPPLNIPVFAFAVPICWGIALRQNKVGNRSPSDCVGDSRQEPPPITPPSTVPVRSTARYRPAVGNLPLRWYWMYLAANLFWLSSIWWIACPHPLTALGLLAMSAVLSLYWVLFFVATSVAVHRFRVPLLVAMPICWIGCEYLRCHILGGFSFCALEHAFYQYPILIEAASIGGSLLVGGIVMFLGAVFLTCFYLSGRWRIAYLAFFLVPSMYLFLFFCFIRILTCPIHFFDGKYDDFFKIVALQGDRQIRLNSEPKEVDANFRQYTDLTYQTICEEKQIQQANEWYSMPDLIVFPETVVPISVLVFEGTVKPADVNLTDEEATQWEYWFRQFVQQVETPVIFGLSTIMFNEDPDKPMRLNSALLVEPQRGDVTGNIYRYDKMHLVMFGEYIPFAEYLPDDFILRTLCPEAYHGNKPVAFPIGQGRGEGSEDRKPLTASINICFESSVAHLIRNQIVTLRKEGHDPRVLINLSNDGWFRFSQQIEQHLATHVFRAVENGMYYVAATNGGYAAIINPWGQIEHLGKRGEVEAVIGNVYVRKHHDTIYQRYGDWYALLFAIIVLGLAIFDVVERRSKKSRDRNQK